MHLYTTYYPQLADERRKRAHRKGRTSRRCTATNLAVVCNNDPAASPSVLAGSQTASADRWQPCGRDARAAPCA